MIEIAVLLGLCSLLFLLILIFAGRNCSTKKTRISLSSFSSIVFNSYNRALTIHYLPALGIAISFTLLYIELNLLSLVHVNFLILFDLLLLVTPYAYIRMLYRSGSSHTSYIELNIVRVIEILQESNQDIKIEKFLFSLFDSFETQTPSLKTRILVTEKRRAEYAACKTEVQNRNDWITELFNSSLDRWEATSK